MLLYQTIGLIEVPEIKQSIQTGVAPLNAALNKSSTGP
jgi:hypothetical protein